MTSLLLRTDASATTGGGHAMRSLALAEAAIARGGSAVMVMVEGADVMRDRLTAAGVALETIDAVRGSTNDAERTLEIAKARGVRWIVTDGYALAGDYQRALRDAHDPLLTIDDWGLARSHHARFVVDQNVAAIASDYAGARADTVLMLGCDYALLRQEFVKGASRARATAPRASRFMVTFGASDPAGVTPNVVDALAGLAGDDWHAKVVVGPANPARAAIEQARAKRSARIELLPSANMSELMTWSDLAITAGGSTLWELAYCGVPMIGIAGADNQVANVDRMGELGYAIGLGWHADVDVDRIARAIDALRADAPARSTMTTKLHALVDGLGCARILDRLTTMEP